MNKIKIAVLGTGTVGVISVCHFLRYLTNSHVTCIHNPQKNILGIGESSNIPLPRLLWDALKFHPYRDSSSLDITMKHGVVFKNWRDQDFFSPIGTAQSAFHFNNLKLGEVIFDRCKQVYKDNFTELLGNVDKVNQDEDGVSVSVDNTIYRYDYVIDCRGYPEDYSEYTIADFLPLNTCFAYTIPQPGTWQHTDHVATKHGWMFGIPLSTRQGWGYLFNSSVTDESSALANLSEIFKTDIAKSDIKEFNFKPYRANQFLNGRIMKNGNRALFYEPIEALSGVFYDNVNRSFFDYITNFKTEDQVNTHLTDMAKRYENFICFVYHGGSIYTTDFWQTTSEVTRQHLINNSVWNETVHAIRTNSEPSNFYQAKWWPYVPSIWRYINQGWKYTYF
jgi:tryptophan halogenase